MRIQGFSFIFTAILCGFALSPSADAADLNGYTAEYECRAGGPRCDVDIQTLAAAACDQIVETTTPWGSVNWSNNVICLRAGDHSAKGELVLGQSGTAAARKVLRCVKSDGTQCSDPALAAESERAVLRQITTNGQSYWIFDRLSLDAQGGAFAIKFNNASSNNIVNRILAYNGGASSNGMLDFYTNAGGSSNRIQNSVLRRCALNVGQESYAVQPGSGESDLFVVNNEIYDCVKNIFVAESSSGNEGAPGLVIENNDIYWSSDFYTDCFGNFTPSGRCAPGEYVLNFKQGGTETKPINVTHNRIWGGRIGDVNLAGDGGEGGLIATSVGGPGTAQPYSGADRFLIKDNVLADAQQGVVTTGFGTTTRLTNHSVVGNIVWDIKTLTAGFGTHAFIWSLREGNEMYLNTIIGSRAAEGEPWKRRWLTRWDETNSDHRCNVVIDSDSAEGAAGSGSEADHNVYYNAGTNTSSLGDPNKLEQTLRDRSSSTVYAISEIIRTSHYNNCTDSANSACYLYKVIQSGTSAATPPVYCTALGCETTDGSVTVKAVRGPYTFKRKLKTVAGGESYIIPYATVHASADEATFCPGTTGNRAGIGVTDDTLGTGILAKDLTGAARVATAGALQASSGSNPPPSSGQSPFPGPNPPSIPGLIEAEHYDRGGESIAYHDTTMANEGQAVLEGRNGDAVDVEVTQDAGGGHDVGWVTPTEWLEYTVNVQTAGTYDIEIRHASLGAGGTLHVEFDGVDKTGSVALPDTAGWQTWQTTTVTGVSLSAGQQLMKLAFDTGNAGWLANINYVRITPSGNTPVGVPYPGPNSAAIPGTIELENYDIGDEGVAYHDSSPTNEPGAYRTDAVDVEVTQDVGGGHDVGWVTPGEWLTYSVNVASAGTYDIEIRHASLGVGGTLHIEFNGVDKTGGIALPDTGGWQTWQTTTVTGVSLSAGQQLMKLAFDTGNAGWLANINYVRFIQR